MRKHAFWPLIVTIALVACRRADVVKSDPTPWLLDAQPQKPEMPTRVVLHGRIVDLASGDVVFPLRAAVPRAEINDDVEAFVIDADDVLRVYDLASGKLRWSLPTKATRLALDRHHLYLADGRNLDAIDRKLHTAKRWVSTKHPIEELHVIGDRLLIYYGVTGLMVFEIPSGKTLASEHVAIGLATTMDQRDLQIAPSGQGFCFVTVEAPDHVVTCLDLDLKPRSRTVLALSKPTDPPLTRMALRAIGRAHMVIGTWSSTGLSSVRRSAVVRLSDGKEVARVEDEVSALAERPDGTLEGLIVTSPETRMLTPTGVMLWHVKPKYVGQFVQAFLYGDRVVTAAFDELTTNVHVSSLSLVDGRTFWTGEILVTSITHTTYPNSVELTVRGDAVVVRSHEPSREHVQVYDATTGALRFSDPPKK